MGSRLVYERGGTAPIRATIDAKAGELALFSAMDRKRIIVAALRTGAEYYRQQFLPQLFTARVYRAPFNYRIKPRYAAKKKKLGLGPLQGPNNPAQPRHLKDAAENDSYISVASKGTKATMTIHIPGVDHVNYNQMVLDILNSLPSDWIEKLAEVIGGTISTLIVNSEVVSSNQRQISQGVRTTIGTTNSRQGWRNGEPRKVLQ